MIYVTEQIKNRALPHCSHAVYALLKMIKKAETSSREEDKKAQRILMRGI